MFVVDDVDAVYDPVMGHIIWHVRVKEKPKTLTIALLWITQQLQVFKGSTMKSGMHRPENPKPLRGRRITQTDIKPNPTWTQEANTQTQPETLH